MYPASTFLSRQRAASAAEVMLTSALLLTRRIPVGTDDAFSNVSNICVNWEDQNIWVDKRGNFHTIFHAFRGQPT